MSNSLNIDLTDKVVIFIQDALSVPATEHPFLVRGGFGARNYTMGRAIFGTFLRDHEDARMNSWDVERLATGEEITAAIGGAADRAARFFATGDTEVLLEGLQMIAADPLNEGVES